MTPKAEYRILFNRRKNTKSKDGRFPIEIEAYIPKLKERKYFATGIRITPDQWYTGKKENTYVNRKHPNYHQLNNRIRETLKRYNDIENKYFENGQPFHLRFLLGTQCLESEKSFILYWEKFIKNEQKRFSENHIKNNRTALSHLKKFRKDVLFADLTKSFLIDFELYLLNYRYEKNGELHSLKGASIHNIFKDFRACVNRAINDEILSSSPFAKFKFSHYKHLDPQEIKYLTPDEVKRIECLEFNENQKHLKRKRDIFLFGCYTGLRFGDISRLTRKHIREEGRKLYVDIIQQKTKKPVHIPLHSIFNKKPYYLMKSWMATGRTKLIGLDTIQSMDRDLKIIAKMAGIKKNLTFHMSRHTCATWMISLGADLYAVKDMLGHSSIVTTESYAKLVKVEFERRLESLNY